MKLECNALPEADCDSRRWGTGNDQAVIDTPQSLEQSLDHRVNTAMCIGYIHQTTNESSRKCETYISTTTYMTTTPDKFRQFQMNGIYRISSLLTAGGWSNRSEKELDLFRYLCALTYEKYRNG